MKTLDGIEISPDKMAYYWYITDSDGVDSIYGRLEGDKIVWWDEEGKNHIYADAVYSTRKTALLAAIAQEK